ncbi:MAG: CPBP family intramembrane glutamic endopeptidase [Eubacteriales bacterium]
MNEDCKIKKENIFVKLYRCVSPMIYNFIITLLIQFPIGVLISMIAIRQSFGDQDLYNEIIDGIVMENSLLILGVILVVTMPFMIMMKYFDRKKMVVWQEWKNFRLCNEKQIVMVAILAISFCIALNNLIALSGIQELFTGYEEISEGIFIAPIGLQIVVAGILAPIVEEFIFRGLIYRRIRYYMNIKWGIMISSLFFGVYHGNVVQCIYATLMGVLMAYIYEKYHSILWPIIFHAIANITAVCITSTDLGVYLHYNIISFFIVTIVTIMLTIVSFNTIQKDAFQHKDEIIGETNENNSTFNTIR